MIAIIMYDKKCFELDAISDLVSAMKNNGHEVYTIAGYNLHAPLAFTVIPKSRAE